MQVSNFFIQSVLAIDSVIDRKGAGCMHAERIQDGRLAKVFVLIPDGEKLSLMQPLSLSKSSVIKSATGNINTNLFFTSRVTRREGGYNSIIHRGHARDGKKTNIS